VERAGKEARNRIAGTGMSLAFLLEEILADHKKTKA